MRRLMIAAMAAITLTACHGNTACRGRAPHRDPTTGDMTCGPRTRTVRLSEIETSADPPPARRDDIRCRQMGTILRGVDDEDICYCDCRSSGRDVFTCKRLCGMY